DWDVGVIDPSAAQTLTLTAHVDSQDSLTNTATVKQADQFDPDPTNNTATATETPQHADRDISKTGSNPKPNMGATVTFTITVTNNETDAATNVPVTDQLPAGLSFVAATPSQGNYNSSNGVWTVNTVSASATATLLLEASVVSFNAQTNTATISHADQFDPDGENNSDTATETPQR